MPKRKPHAAEERAAAAGFGKPVAVSSTEAAALLATGDYTRSVGLDLGATHWRAGPLHLTQQSSSATDDGLATGSDGADVVAASGASTSTSSVEQGTGDGGDAGGWALHLDHADPHAGPVGFVAHVAQDVPHGGTVLLIAFSAITAVAAYYYRRVR